VAEALFCTRCGRRLVAEALQCPECGAPRYGGDEDTSARRRCEAPTKPIGKGFKQGQAGRHAPSPGSAAQSAGHGPRRLDGYTFWLRRPARAAIVAAAVVVFGWWLLFYLPDSPSYALYRFETKIEAHDGDGAARFVDFESVTRALMNSAVEARRESESEQPPGGGGARLFGEAIARGIISLMVKPVSKVAEARFKRAVERGKWDSPGIRGVLVRAVFKLRRDGDQAATEVTSPEGKTLRIRLTRDEVGHWRISSVQGLEAEIVQELRERRHKGKL